MIDKTTGKPVRHLDLEIGSQSFVRNVSFAPGVVYVGTDTNCLAVPLASGVAVTTLADGNCTAIKIQQDGTAWLSTDGLYRHDTQDWRRWLPGQSGAIAASSIEEDGMSNVWLGASDGLWRYFDLAREHRFSGNGARISSMAGDLNGGVVAGLANGEVWHVNRKLEATQIALPAPTETPSSPYYRGALVADGTANEIWVLSAAGLFKVDGSMPKRMAEFPSMPSNSQAVPSSLAISAEGMPCTGLLDSTVALCFKDGSWQQSAEVMDDFGGRSVAAVTFDTAGSLLAVGIRSISVAGKTQTELGPFEPTPFGVKHLFGAIANTTSVDGVDAVASGGWGGTAFLKRSGEAYREAGSGLSTVQDQPYIIRQFASHPSFGLLAGADEGLFVWNGDPISGHWKSLRDIDPRLAAGLDGVVVSDDRSFWVGSGLRLSLIELPKAAPQAEIQRSPSTDTIDTNAVTYKLSVPGLVGLPASKSTAITYSPSIANAERGVTGPTSRLDLSNLADLTTYRVTAEVTDGFLNIGPTLESKFSVKLPFYQNPYKLGAVVVAAIMFLGLLLTRRGPTGFVLLRIGRLRWSTEKDDPRFAIEVKNLGPDVVRYELEAPSALTLIRLVVDVPAPQLDASPKEILPYLVRVAEGKVRPHRERFDTAMKRAASVLGEEALPENVRFMTSQFDSGAISVDLSKSLLWLPIELANDGGASQVMLRYAIGRSVSGDVLVESEPLRSSRLRVAIFAPHLDPSTPSLPQAEAEAKSVAAAARKWGAEVDFVRPDATKQQVLDAICAANIFHYAGHAEFSSGAAGNSYLPISGGHILAAEIAAALQSAPHNLLLAFINGCGSSREDSWERGLEIYGFASAFLNNAVYFIGAQWPIQDEIAALLAGEFYARLFPASYSLWWQLIRRNPLQGTPFAEALRLARLEAREFGPEAVQTWSSYVFYGDPTRRLVLQ
ncbi:CHAT domain-containing protein [Mesorhizobium newzealandense]|uniref:CHAT domain-containing protein n=1 Tax=Mesorhizobium newzealandense TaxID=1300302 RepID=A0ABW4UEP7_9HYPH